MKVITAKLVNEREFRDMLKRRLAVETKMTSAKLVNKCALQVLIGAKGESKATKIKGAVDTTAKATTKRIKADLGKKYGQGTLATRKNGTVGKRVQWTQKPTKLIFLLASKQLVKQGVKWISREQWRSEVASTAERIAKSRNSSRAFLAAGWLKAAQALGGNARTTVGQTKLKSGGRAAHGHGIRATPESLTAIGFNNAVAKRGGGGDDPRAYAIAAHALDRALAHARADLEKYVVRKELSAMLAKYSDK